MPGQSKPPEWLKNPIPTYKTVQAKVVFGTSKPENFKYAGYSDDNVLFEEAAKTNRVVPKVIEGLQDINEEDFAFYETVKTNKEADRSSNDPYAVGRSSGMWIVTCDYWIQKGISALVCNTNPSDVSWNMPLRSSIIKTRSGFVTNVWGDRNKGDKAIFDNPSLNITWQSGNILPFQIKGKKVVPAGIDRFYKMLDLLGNSKSVLSNGLPNRVHITYRSLIFPKITLTGQFSAAGTTFQESSSNPTMFTYSTEFIIQTSIPSLSGQAIKHSLLSTYKNKGSWA